MKKSEVFKTLALGMAGAYVFFKVKENPQAFGLLPSPEEKAQFLLNKIQKDFSLSPRIQNIINHAHDFTQERRYNKAIDVTPKGKT